MCKSISSIDLNHTVLTEIQVTTTIDSIANNETDQRESLYESDVTLDITTT